MLPDSEMGMTIPPNDPHAISVSLPTWRDHVGWGNKEKWAVEKMKSGYPRFFVHESITRLGERIHQKYGDPDLDEKMLFFPTRQIAEQGLEYYLRYSSTCKTGNVYSCAARVLTFSIPHETRAELDPRIYEDLRRWTSISALIFPAEEIGVVRQFWQHIGEGVSTRQVEVVGRIFNEGLLTRVNAEPECCALDGRVPSSRLDTDSGYSSPNAYDGKAETLRDIWEGLRVVDSERAKRDMRGTLADLYSSAVQVEEGDVWLYPSGMSAIWNTFRAVSRAFAPKSWRQTICYGFTYVDTYKILSKFSSSTLTDSSEGNVLFYGHATSSDLDDLESRLDSGERFSALFCEIAGNPLLGTPDFERIGELRRKFGFAVVVDDTVATVGNVDVLDVADVVCSSLSKTFSGGCNVMGGSVVLNPTSPLHSNLKHHLNKTFTDTYFPPDSLVMHQNSLNFLPRLDAMNTNTYNLLPLLLSHPSIREIYHPSLNPTKDFYTRQLRPHPLTFTGSDGNKKVLTPSYGYLLSISFHRPADAVTFLDTLDVAKGPSLGTEFTLASAYTLLAHPKELEWAAEYGVEEFLVRISVGMEEWEGEGGLRERVERALEEVERRRGKEGVNDK